MTNLSKPNSRQRAVAHPGSPAAQVRSNIYRAAFSHINNAVESGFYLEAITLIESLISDRLESRATFLLKADFSFKTLGALITRLKKLEVDPVMQDLVQGRVNNWRKSRNAVLHELPKIAAGDVRTWEQRLAPLEDLVSAGLTILRAVDRRVKALRKGTRALRRPVLKGEPPGGEG